MPDSAAVYQPTTVGYMYDAGVDGNEGGVTLGGGPGIRSGFSRIIFRHKVSTRKWLEWVLLSVAICATIAGLTTMVVDLLSKETISVTDKTVQNDQKNSSGSETATKIEDQSTGDPSRSSIAVGASITLLGLLMGALWTWLRFFRRGKSQRGGMSRASGQMLGGLNPSTDLLVGSTSQYGPVLTEVPSQMTNKQIINETRAIPMSDQEEETHTLMPDSTANTTKIDSNHLSNQLAG